MSDEHISSSDPVDGAGSGEPAVATSPVDAPQPQAAYPPAPVEAPAGYPAPPPPPTSPPPIAGYAAPATYAPPPAYAPPAQAYAQPVPPGMAPPAAKRGGSRTLMIVGITAVALILILAVGGFVGNASLSSTYGPGKAVQNYFAAQARGDAGYMFANANYLKDNSGSDAQFGKEAVTQMVTLPENRSVSNVVVTSTRQVDSSTANVFVTMSWNNSTVNETYTAHKDTSRSHFVFYNDWKLDIPFSTVSLTLPNQPGVVRVDGIAAPSPATSIGVIQGYHTISMLNTAFYDTDNETVSAMDPTVSLAFKAGLSSSATSAAAAAIKSAFQPGNFSCDVVKYWDCPGHLYGGAWILQMPGGDITTNTNYIFNFTGDPSSGMSLTVTTTTGQLDAKGKCATQLVVDGSQKYNYTGTWSGTLTWNSGTSAFRYNGTFSCDDVRA